MTEIEPLGLVNSIADPLREIGIPDHAFFARVFIDDYFLQVVVVYQRFFLTKVT